MNSTALSRTLPEIALHKLQLSRGRECEAILLDKLAELEAQATALGCPQSSQLQGSCHDVTSAADCGCAR